MARRRTTDKSRDRAASDWPRHRRVLLYAVLLVAGFLAYANSFSGVFLLDDVRHIVRDERLHTLWPIGRHLSRPRPVVDLSLAINYAVGGSAVAGYHAVNLAVHLLTGLALMGVVHRTLLRVRPRSPRRESFVLAFIVALLWIVHPLTTQSVTYVIQRGEAMMALFYLATLYCFIRGVDSAYARRWYVAAVVACAMGMGSKAVMVTAPVAVLLFDRMFAAPSWRELLRRRWGLYLGLCSTWVILFAVGTAGGVLLPDKDADTTVGFGYKGVSPIQYAVTQPGVIVHYLRLALFPVGLCLDYGWSVARTAGAIVPPVIILLGLLTLTVWAVWRRHALGFAGAMFFLVLAPTSSIIPIKDLAFEHRMYLPLAAVVATVVIGGRYALHRVYAHIAIQPSTARWMSTGLVLAAAVSLGYGTIARNKVYGSAVAMWSDVVATRPANARAHSNLGVALFDVGRLEEAVVHYRKAIELDGEYRQAYNNLGNALAGLDRYDEAFAAFTKALELRPDYVDAHVSFGSALSLVGRYDDAIGHYRRSLELRPRNVLCLNNLGNALLSQAVSDQDEAKVNLALEMFRRALALAPGQAYTHNNLANALATTGDLAAGAEHYVKAISLDPNLVAAHYNLAEIYRKLQRPDDARAEYLTAITVAGRTGDAAAVRRIRERMSVLEAPPTP